MKPQVLAVLILFLSAAADVFAGTSINAQVDKTRLTAGELLTYKLTVISTEKEIPSPELPGFAKMRIVSSSQSSTVSFGQGEMRTQAVFILVLLPLEPGKIKIGPAQITVKGKRSASDPFLIDVLPGSGKMQPRGEDNSTRQEDEEPGPAIPGSSQPKYTL